MNTSKTRTRTKPVTAISTNRRLASRKSGAPEDQSFGQPSFGQQDLFSQLVSEPTAAPAYFPSDDSTGILANAADAISSNLTSAGGASVLRFGGRELSVGVFIVFLIATVIFV